MFAALPAIIASKRASGGGGGPTYTVERTWKIKHANQFMSQSQFSGWHTLPGTSDNTIPAGTTWSNLRDSANVTTSSIGFVAIDAWTGSGNSTGPANPGGAGTGIFCDNILTMAGWVNTAVTTLTFKITGLTAGKYYQIGIFANTENYKGNYQSASTSSGGSASAWKTGNNYGDCGPGDDLSDAAIIWIYNNTPTSGEIIITLNRTAGTEICLSGLIVQQTNIAKP
jgi:hypothetical protein